MFIAGLTFGALAVPVTKWNVEVNSGFTSYSPTPAVHGDNTNALLAAPSLLWWGESTLGASSSIGVGAATNGTYTGAIDTNAAAVDTVQVTHNNKPIGGASLVRATLTDVITLQRALPAPPGTFYTPAALTFNINFLETNNDGSCEVASPIPCNDIFVLDVIGAGFNPADNSLNQTFWYESEDYNAILQIAGLGVLSNAACDAVFGNTLHRGCKGFTTVEGQNNVFQVSLRITDTPYDPVPEPATLVLVGLALLTLGAVRRHQA